MSNFAGLLSPVFNEMKTLKKSIDRMKTYTYNKSTVWFLSTPIQYLLLGNEQRPLLAKRFFFVYLGFGWLI